MPRRPVTPVTAFTRVVINARRVTGTRRRSGAARSR